MNGSAAGCSGRFPSGLAFLRGSSYDFFRSRLAAPPGAGMAVSLGNRPAPRVLRVSGGGFRPWRTDFALQPRPVSREALWPCSRSLVLFWYRVRLAPGSWNLAISYRCPLGSAASSRAVGHRQFPARLKATSRQLNTSREAGAATGREKSEKHGVQAARNAPSEDRKCWRALSWDPWPEKLGPQKV